MIVENSYIETAVGRNYGMIKFVLITGMDLEILGRGFLTTASGLLISQLSLMVALSFYHPLISKSFMDN